MAKVLKFSLDELRALAKQRGRPLIGRYEVAIYECGCVLFIRNAIEGGKAVDEEERDVRIVQFECGPLRENKHSLRNATKKLDRAFQYLAADPSILERNMMRVRCTHVYPSE